VLYQGTKLIDFSGSSAKTHQLLTEKKNRSILKTVSDDARTLLSTSRRESSITQKEEPERSSLSLIGNEEFDFDDIIINSTVYRRAFLAYQARQTSDSKDKGKEIGVVDTISNVNDSDIPVIRGEELDAANEQIRTLQRQILSAKSNSDFLVIRDEDYFDAACQQLYQHVQQWVLRFSKFSDMRVCRFSSEIPDDKIIDRLDNVILDGSDVDSYLSDRVKRRDVFMSVVVSMIWEYIFVKYLFGMDRQQRSMLKSLESLLLEVGELGFFLYF
jgi:hypothetical protein